MPRLLRGWTLEAGMHQADTGAPRKVLIEASHSSAMCNYGVDNVSDPVFRVLLRNK